MAQPYVHGHVHVKHVSISWCQISSIKIKEASFVVVQ